MRGSFRTINCTVVAVLHPPLIGGRERRTVSRIVTGVCVAIAAGVVGNQRPSDLVGGPYQSVDECLVLRKKTYRVVYTVVYGEGATD